MADLFNFFKSEFPDLEDDELINNVLAPFKMQTVDIHEPMEGSYLKAGDIVLCKVGRFKSEFDEGTWYRGFYYFWKGEVDPAFTKFVDNLYLQVEQVLSIQSARREMREATKLRAVEEWRRKRMPLEKLAEVAKSIGDDTGQLVDKLIRGKYIKNPTDDVYREIVNAIRNAITEKTMVKEQEWSA